MLLSKTEKEEDRHLGTPVAQEGWEGFGGKSTGYRCKAVEGGGKLRILGLSSGAAGKTTKRCDIRGFRQAQTIATFPSTRASPFFPPSAHSLSQGVPRPLPKRPCAVRAGSPGSSRSGFAAAATYHRRGPRELGPSRSPPHCCLMKLHFSLQIAAPYLPRPSVPGAPRDRRGLPRPSRPRSQFYQNRLLRPGWACAPGPRALGFRRLLPDPRGGGADPQEGMLGAAGSKADVPDWELRRTTGAGVRSPAPGRGGRAHSPLAPAGRKTTGERSLPPLPQAGAQLPPPWPGSALCKGAPVGGGTRRLGPPSPWPLRSGRQPGVEGQLGSGVHCSGAGRAPARHWGCRPGSSAATGAGRAAGLQNEAGPRGPQGQSCVLWCAWRAASAAIAAFCALRESGRKMIPEPSSQKQPLDSRGLFTGRNRTARAGVTQSVGLLVVFFLAGAFSPHPVRSPSHPFSSHPIPSARARENVTVLASGRAQLKQPREKLPV